MTPELAESIVSWIAVSTFALMAIGSVIVVFRWLAGLEGLPNFVVNFFSRM